MFGIEFTPEIQAAIGTMLGGAVVGAGFAFWKRVKKWSEAKFDELTKKTDEIKEGVEQVQNGNGLGLVKRQIADLQTSHQEQKNAIEKLNDKVDRLILALIPHSNGGDD